MADLEKFAETQPKTKKQIKEELDAALRLVEDSGYVAHKPSPPSSVAEFDTSKVRGERVRIAIISDTHLGSKHQQVSLLREFCAYAKSLKVNAVLHGGDVTDGPPQMHPGHLHNLFLQTYDAQRTYAIDNLPQTSVPTYAISGNHDESWLKNNAGPIVEDICHARGWEFVGQSAGYIRFGDVLVYLHHPHDGGSYALSYKLQKKIEALSPESKPHIFLAGNYHKATHLPAYRNCDGFLLPAFQSQTPFMVSKGLPSIVGGVILEFGIVNKGLAPSLKTEWVLYREPRAGDWP
jgi:predicted phosphodiesterase